MTPNPRIFRSYPPQIKKVENWRTFSIYGLQSHCTLLALSFFGAVAIAQYAHIPHFPSNGFPQRPIIILGHIPIPCSQLGQSNPFPHLSSPTIIPSSHPLFNPFYIPEWPMWLMPFPLLFSFSRNLLFFTFSFNQNSNNTK